MKIKFEVEKIYKGKTYYPNIEYEMSEEMAKDILSKTKFAHEVGTEVECFENVDSFPKGPFVDNVEKEVEKPKKKKKEIKKD